MFYNDIPETNQVSRVHSVAAVLHLQFVLLAMLFPMLNALHSCISTALIVCAVPNTAVFCSSLMSFFPIMLLRYFLNYFYVVPFAPIIGNISVFIFQYFYYKVFIIIIIIIIIGVRDGAVGWGTALQAGRSQVRFPIG
jgi:hypothetical protein